MSDIGRGPPDNQLFHPKFRYGTVIRVSAVWLSWTCLIAAAEPVDQLQAWGGDHVGEPIPNYVTGDECLFCHRDIGATWPDNRHLLTLRPADPTGVELKALANHAATKPFVRQAQLLLGGQRQTRYLRRSNDYGKLDMLNVTFNAKQGLSVDGATPNWDTETYARQCAGCHTTAVDAKTLAFSALAIDCYCCHGSVSLEHTKDTSRIFLSASNRDARQVISACGQCHLRGGRSRSTALPYPNNFVAGDNLFRDFAVDLSNDEIAGRDPIEGHILANTRAVMVDRREEVTCLTCHDVHAQSTEKHQALDESTSCLVCHIAGRPQSEVKAFRSASRTCGY